MSHTSAIKAITIQSIDALRAAVEELNSKGVKCSLVQGGAPRAYFSNQQGMGQAAYVIRLDNSRYDIGIYAREEGGFEARTDFWAGDVEKQLGAPASSPAAKEQAKMGKLFQLYAIHAAMQEARKKGLSTRRQVGANGREQVIVTGYR